ncbi:MAG: S41 family peptidase [Myxococcota bacterium]
MRSGSSTRAFALWATTLIGAGCSAEDAAVGQAPLARAEALEDIARAEGLLFAIHPEPARHVSHAVLEAAFEDVRRNLPAELTRAELYQRLAPVLARVADGHTGLRPPGPRSPPLALVAHRGALYLAADLPGAPAGSRVEELLHHPGPAWVARCLALASGAGEARKEQALGSVLAFLVDEARDSEDGGLPLTLTLPDGTRRRLPAVSPPASSPRLPARVAALPGGAVYLALRTMTGTDHEVEAFFVSLFRWLDATEASGVVVDLRNNRGGSTYVGDLLLSHLSDRPYRLFGQKRWRVSREMQAYLREQWSGTAFEGYLRAEPGTDFVEVPEVVARPSLGPRFQGPAVLLIGRDTLSAAMMTANAAEDFGLAMLVGEPTSSSPNYFGEVYRTELRHSGLTLEISSAEFVRANGNHADAAPVRPTRHVRSPPGRPPGPSDDAVRVALDGLRALASREP